MVTSVRPRSLPTPFRAPHGVTSRADASFCGVEGHRTAASGGTEQETRGLTR